jgi:hypothetical protein
MLSWHSIRLSLSISEVMRDLTIKAGIYQVPAPYTAPIFAKLSIDDFENRKKLQPFIQIFIAATNY